MSDSNTVIATFVNTKEITTAPIFQYDYGMVLKFGGVELPESYEVHFANYRYGASKVMIGDSTGVEIPYEYTKNYGRVFAWVFIHESEDVGWTKYLAEIPVIQRAKPSYDPVDPYEQSIVEQLVSTVEGLQDDVSGLQEDVQTVGDALKKKADVIVSSASGSVAAFADGADDMPLESLKCYIEPVQSGSGTPSLNNVRAIRGWTGVNVTAAGKNLLPNTATTRTINGVTFTVNPDGSIKASGTNTASSTTSLQLKDGLGWNLPVGEYTLSGTPSGGGANKFFMSLYYNNNGGDNWGKFDFGSGQTYTITDTNQNLGCRIGIAGGATVDVVFYPMLRLSGTDSTYEPYTARTLSVTFPTSAGRVYGGYVDVVKGELVVDRVFIDLATTTYKLELAPTNTASIKRLRIGSPSDFKPASSNSTPPETLISNKYATIGAGTAGTYGGNTGVSVDVGGTLYVCDSSIQTVDAWRASGTTIVTPIGTPEEYTLTPQELNTLLGNNSIYCDTGNTEVSYPADTKLYIDGKIAELQALVLEN